MWDEVVITYFKVLIVAYGLAEENHEKLSENRRFSAGNETEMYQIMRRKNHYTAMTIYTCRIAHSIK
jgi:hypothetical protein